MASLFADHQTTKSGTLAPRARVLVVDDDSRDLEYYRSVLLEQGYDVRVTDSYADAERSVRNESYDFVLVGQGSHAFEGRSVVARALELDRQTPVVVLARSLDIGCYLEAMQLGAVDYLEKPLSPADLSRLIDSHLRTRRVVA
jgi:two-component system C4-dicarboxylate transport response regulator DctD